MLKILTEAGYKKGFGHYSRISSLFDNFQSANIPFKVIVDGDDVAKELIQGDFIDFEKWNSVEFLRNEVNKNDVILIDSYSYDILFLEYAKNCCKDIIVIDDNKRLDYENVKIINPNYFGESIDYSMDRGNTYFIGAKYTLLKSAFKHGRKRNVKDQVTSVLITMGGSDVSNITVPIMKEIISINHNVKLNVVATNAFRNLSDIKKQIRKKDNLVIGASPEKMAELMIDADFAVAAAGGTSNELIRSKCPSILISVADNQKLNLEYLYRKGIAEQFDETTLYRINKMFDVQKRKELVNNMEKVVTEEKTFEVILDIIEK